jgi:hypothetical protein
VQAEKERKREKYIERDAQLSSPYAHVLAEYIKLDRIHRKVLPPLLIAYRTLG